MDTLLRSWECLSAEVFRLMFSCRTIEQSILCHVCGAQSTRSMHMVEDEPENLVGDL